MQLMNPANIVGIAIGASLFIPFSKKHREKTRRQKLGLFLVGFFSVLIGLLILNFGIYYMQQH